MTLAIIGIGYLIGWGVFTGFMMNDGEPWWQSVLMGALWFPIVIVVGFRELFGLT